MNPQSSLLRSSIALSLALASFSLWGQAWAVGVDSPSLSYSLTQDTEAAGTVTIKRSTGPKNATAYYVAFQLLSFSSTAPGGGQALSYGIFKSSSSGIELSLSGSPSSADEVLSGNMASGAATVTASFVFRVSNSTFPAPGTYSAQIQATVYKGSFSASGGAVAQGSSTFTIAASVDKITSVAVVGGASSSYAFKTSGSNPDYQLDLGSLSPSSAGTAFILALSNCSYGLSLSSVNRGAIVNSADSSSMGYEVTVDSGSSYVLSSPATIVSGAAPSSASPARYGLLFRISGFGSNPSAGTYSDTITVTVSAM